MITLSPHTRYRCPTGQALWTEIDAAAPGLEKRWAFELYFLHIHGVRGEVDPCPECGKVMIEHGHAELKGNQ